MPDTVISVPLAVARLSVAMTRCRRRAESAWRPFLIASVLGFAAGGVMRGLPLGCAGVPRRSDRSIFA